MNFFVVFLSHYKTGFESLLVSPVIFNLSVRTRLVSLWTEKTASSREDYAANCNDSTDGTTDK
jgi:hypothetical protein